MTSALRVALFATLVAAGAAAGGDRPRGARIDLWREILAARVTESGEVAYRTLAAFDRKKLKTFIDSLATVDVNRLEGAEAVAFWINAYNAGAVWGVLKGGRPETTNGRARLYSWLEIDVGGRRRSLDSIEAELARFAARDPRVHLAISNGAKSGPALAREPYDADSLEEQLARAATTFVNDPRRNHTGGDRPALSPVFSWHRDDFSRETGAITGWVAKHVANEDEAERLAAGQDLPAFLEVDWRLNAAPGEDPATDPPPATAKR